MKFLKGLKRLWGIATCTHYNTIERAVWNEGGNVQMIIRICYKCGRVIDGVSFSNEEEINKKRTI